MRKRKRKKEREGRRRGRVGGRADGGKGCCGKGVEGMGRGLALSALWGLRPWGTQVYGEHKVYLSDLVGDEGNGWYRHTLGTE